jgi:hypothetical protein
LSEHVTSDDPYLLVEEVAERLGLPLSVLLHRVEAGDIPAQRIESEEGVVHYALRLGDLGIELDDEGLRSSAIGGDGYDGGSGRAGGEGDREGGEGDDETTLSAVFEPDDLSTSVASAIVSAFNSGPEPWPGERLGSLNLTSRRIDEDDDSRGGADAAPERESSDPDSLEPQREAEIPEPAGAGRPREPQEPPVWLTPGRDAIAGEAGDAPGVQHVGDAEDVYAPPPSGPGAIDGDGIPAMVHSGLDAETEEEVDADEDTAVAELAVPRPSPDAQVGILEAGVPGPRGDLASMSLDARELVAGLLDRWERTLEQRIYTEQRQRFQAELVARQNTVKQLQMELHTARAEHAAAQAEKDRILAGKERELADRERDLAETRRVAQEAERMIAPAGSRRRRWFWNRDD